MTETLAIAAVLVSLGYTPGGALVTATEIVEAADSPLDVLTRLHDFCPSPSATTPFDAGVLR